MQPELQVSVYSDAAQYSTNRRREIYDRARLLVGMSGRQNPAYGPTVVATIPSSWLPQGADFDIVKNLTRRSGAAQGGPFHKFVFRRDCTLESMLTHGAISFLSSDLVFLPVFPDFLLAVQPIVVMR
jgi:hypothetical protein